MQCTGIDLHTNRFTCCYRDERLSGRPPDRVMKTFDLNEQGLAAFYGTLTEDTYALVEVLKERVLLAAEPFMTGITILTSRKGVSVFIAIAIIADIIEVSRFKDTKHFTLYLRSALRAANSNTTVKNCGWISRCT
jgi:hypothetical protein